MGKVGRKRKFVRVEYDANREPHMVEKGGTEIDGLSFDASRTVKCFYTRIAGERKKTGLGRNLKKAIEAVTDENDEPAKVTVKFQLPPTSLNELVANSETFGQKLAAARAVFITPAGQAIPAAQKLSDCREYWQEQKIAEGREPENLKTVSRRFNCFIQLVGDLPINQIKPENFEAWNAHLLTEQSKNGFENKWYNDHYANVRSILKFVKKRKGLQGWSFPDGMLEWADAYKSQKPYSADDENAEPMPPEDFKRLLAACDVWAATEIDSIDKSTQWGKAKRRQAGNRIYRGRQARILLALTCNAALDPIGIERLEWSHLHLDAKVPYFGMPRYKTKWKVGQPTKRFTPLLPSIAAALRSWQSEAPQGVPYVFRSTNGGRLTSKATSRLFDALRVAARFDNGQTMRHLGNVAPALRFLSGKLPDDMSERITGHKIWNREGRKYEGSFDETYLIPLVNIIGEQYFDGEQVKQ